MLPLTRQGGGKNGAEKMETKYGAHQKSVLRFLGAVFGTALYAAGMNLFIVPLNLYSGGLMGVCQLIRTFLIQYLHFPFRRFDIAGIIYYIIDIPLLYMAYKFMGRPFFVKTVVCITTMTFFLTVIPIPQKGLLTDDILTSSIIGGIICGAGSGLTLMMGGSGGGMDIIGLYSIRTDGRFSVGKINLLVSLFVYAVCLFLFNPRLVVYSVIFAAVSSIATDKVHSQNINVEILVITKKDSAEMERDVLKVLGRGLTRWNATGGFTSEKTEVLYIVLSKYECGQLKQIIHKHDPNAFLVAKEHVMVSGHYLKKL
jgi:uncharacterized membrane-anchored protein YitT (DUF2179 family)